jgi:hypothetical protein
MKEVKLEIPNNRKLVPMDIQDQGTLDKLNDEKKVSVYLDADDSQDEIMTNAKGEATRVRCFNVNGIQWFVPVQQHTDIPFSIYEIWRRSQEVGSRPRIRPGVINLGQFR